MKKLMTYELDINEDEAAESGVDYVALVDDPAIKENWMTFEAQKSFAFKVSAPERRIITGAAMIADMPIYRKDDVRGEYNVVFRKPVIEKIVKKWAKLNKFNNVNMMHEEDTQTEGIYCIESFIVDSSRGITTPKIFDKAPDGSWFLSYYIENDMVWNEFIKTGIFKGFSVEGMFGFEIKAQAEVVEVDADEKHLQTIFDILNFADSYTDYPQGASNNAKRALEWVDKHGWGSCGEATGKARSHQLANREPITRDTIARMSAFRRHQQYKDVPYSEGCGGLMWDCWGGDSGISWAENKLKEIDKK